MKKSIIILVIFAISLIFLISGCKDDTGMSIDDRIDAFVSDLNDGNRDNIKEHFHPSTGSSSNLDEDTLNTGYFPNVSSTHNYTLNSNSEQSSNTRLVKIVDTTGGLYDTGDDFLFTMKEDGDEDWYILKLALNGTTIYQ